MKQEKIDEAIQKLTEVYKFFDNEETDIIADYSMEYGSNSDYWDEEILQKFNKELDPIQDVIKEIWNIKKKLEKGEFNRGN